MSTIPARVRPFQSHLGADEVLELDAGRNNHGLLTSKPCYVLITRLIS